MIYWKGLSSKAKLFAGYKSLFSVIHDSNTSKTESNDDLSVIKNWAFQRKTSFHKYSKQTEEVNFSKNTITVNNSPLIFNNSAITQATFQKFFGVIFGSRLNPFNDQNSHYVETS